MQHMEERYKKQDARYKQIMQNVKIKMKSDNVKYKIRNM